MRYYFYDSNCYTGEDLYLRGKAYSSLIDFCFAHSQTISFSISKRQEIQHEKWLEQFRIERPTEIICNDDLQWITNPNDNELRFYKACSQIHQWMLSYTDNMFEWIDGWGYHNPENPSFYRADGSLLLLSVIHEGELRANINGEEELNFSSVRTLARWVDKCERAYPSMFE